MGCPEKFEDIVGKKLPNVTGFILEKFADYVNFLARIKKWVPVVIIIKKREKS